MSDKDVGEHDYVVIGAGSFGRSVLVRRLRDRGRSVHVIEAGSIDDDPMVHSPQRWPAWGESLARRERPLAGDHDHRSTPDGDGPASSTRSTVRCVGRVRGAKWCCPAGSSVPA